MTISPLSETTSRVLGATVVLNDATSVIKELVDNALDSRATSVAIELSGNTLDVILLKDNGTGVGVEDRQLLCKRGCTSKIRTLDDLDNLGGKSLGFRGEALASITNLSESVAITTRVEGELVGTVLRFGPDGKLLSSASASHPVGTTVRVQNFLTSIPVRRQTASKQSNKTLSEIKQLLQNYAFARPTVRFGLKVLKGKNDKANWSYAPCNTVNELSVAATKIVGKDVAALCKHSTIILDKEAAADEQYSTYKIHSLLLDPSSNDVSKSGATGQFVSLDGRPLNSECGTIKKITKLYKSYLHQALGDNMKPPSKPFLCAHIYCPSGSYDINVEPAKGEVMFHRPELIIELAEKTFRQCYGELQENQTSNLPPASRTQTHGVSSFDVLLARKAPPKSKLPDISEPAAESTEPAEEDTDSMEDPTTPISPQLLDAQGNIQARAESAVNKTLRNMYTTDDDDDGTRSLQTPRGMTSAEPEDDDSNAMSSIRNPFTTAKLHARLFPRKFDSTTDPFDGEQRADQGSNLVHHDDLTSSSPATEASINASRTPATRIVPCLPTPSKTPGEVKAYQNPGPPLRRRQPRAEDDDIYQAGSADSHSDPDPTRAGRNPLDRWIERSSPAVPNRTIQSARDLLDQDRRLDAETGTGDDSLTEGPSRQYVSSPSSTSPSSLRMPRAQKPFRSPLKPDQGTARLTSNVQRSHDFDEINSPHSNIERTLPSNSDLDDVMEFEHRKKALNQRRKGVQSQLNPADLARMQRDSLLSEPSTTSPINDQSHENRRADLPSQADYATRFSVTELSTPPAKSNPHHNRYLAATRNLASRSLQQASEQSDLEIKIEQASQDTPVLTASIPASDPRGYLFSIKSILNPNVTPKRINLTRLPLEAIPSRSTNLNTLAIPPSSFPSPPHILNLTSALSKKDPYIQTGKIRPLPFDPYSNSIHTWETKLEELIQTLYRTTPDPSPESPPPQLKISLTRAIKSHIEAVNEEL